MSLVQAFQSRALVVLSLSGTGAATSMAAFPDDGENILIYNSTTAAIAFDAQPATFSATATSPTIVPAGARHVMTVPRGPLFVSAIGVSTVTGNVYVMRGDGNSY